MARTAAVPRARSDVCTVIRLTPAGVRSIGRIVDVPEWFLAYRHGARRPVGGAKTIPLALDLIA